MMPFYGSVDYFKQAVESVVAQDDSRWRLVVIDDLYPSDEPERFIREFRDNRIHYVRNEKNLGISGNFQKAIELAENASVVIMGCDDALLPNYVSRLHELQLANPDVSYFQPGVRVIDASGDEVRPLGDRVKAVLRRKLGAPTVLRGEVLAQSLLQGNWTYFPSICWKLENLRRAGFRRDYEIVLDLALQLDIVQHDGSMFVDDKDSFLYRRHHSSASMWTVSNGVRFEEEKRLFREFSDVAEGLGWKNAARAARWHSTSRLNAALELARSLVLFRGNSVTALWDHVTK